MSTFNYNQEKSHSIRKDQAQKAKKPQVKSSLNKNRNQERGR